MGTALIVRMETNKILDLGHAIDNDNDSHSSCVSHDHGLLADSPALLPVAVVPELTARPAELRRNGVIEICVDAAQVWTESRSGSERAASRTR